ncbi:hypothetical protein MNBD_GAMMA10-508 [hydrothermal vent metagenome]|uniref:YtkA-like domain-containing protein n=1 Tax=hydrothermal vent metagenome TaxID=652676 RepID=A0A3B0X8Y1_9ZZZZ
MSDALVNKNKIPDITYKKLYFAEDVKRGEVFWVDIQFRSEDGYEMDFPRHLLPEGLEYVKNDESKYYLKASQPGTYQFEIWVMDKRTLITNTANFEVTVKD